MKDFDKNMTKYSSGKCVWNDLIIQGSVNATKENIEKYKLGEVNWFL